MALGAVIGAVSAYGFNHTGLTAPGKDRETYGDHILWWTVFGAVMGTIGWWPCPGDC
jgi:hypothetical protein